MAYLAIRGSGAVNGVSRLHGEVSRRLVPPLADGGSARRARDQRGSRVELGIPAAADDLSTQACGKDHWLVGAGARHSPPVGRQALAVPHRDHEVSLNTLASGCPGS